MHSTETIEIDVSLWNDLHGWQHFIEENQQINRKLAEHGRPKRHSVFIRYFHGFVWALEVLQPQQFFHDGKRWAAIVVKQD